MAPASASVHVRASLAEAWEYFLDPSTWSAWVDGFSSLEAVEGYPEVGGTLRWRSIPAGRGEVEERVLEHEPRRLHRVAFTDPQSEGELTTRFAIEQGADGEPGTRVTQELDYRLRRPGPFAWLASLLFVGSQVGRSLERQLNSLRLGIEEVAGLGKYDRHRSDA